MIDLAGRRVLVTGGSRGIGAACCRLFARAGASVLIHYHRRDGLAAALLDELGALSRGHHLARRCDLRDAAEVRNLFAFVAAEWGSLDTLINNAGIWVPNPLADLDAAGLDETLAINVVGSFLCAAAALPLLALSGDGCIVNLTSTAGQRGEALYSPYAASKGAMIAATKSWACELAPGWVDTDMTAGALAGEERRAALGGIPLGRIATPEEIAGPVLFLASPLARHITGEVLNVNGGSVLAG